MNLERVLAELRRERDAIERAILNLEQLGRSGNGRASHPPDLTTKSPTVNLSPEESS
jgi:ABC-type transporter Mla subunit MlaD